MTGTVLDTEEMAVNTADKVTQWPAETFLYCADVNPHMLSFNAFEMQYNLLHFIFTFTSSHASVMDTIAAFI